MNDRELATLIWLAIFIGWVLTLRDVRSGVPSMLKAAATPKLLVPFTAMAVWISGLIYAASRIGLWTDSQIGDTAAWVVLSGFGLFGASMTVFKEPGALRKIILRAVAITAFIEVYVNLVVFPLPIELLLLPALTVLTLSDAVAAGNPEFAQVKTLVDWLLAAVGFALLIYVTLHLVTHVSELHLADLGRRFGLPIWLTFGLLPFIAALAVYAHYDKAFSMIRWACPESDRRRRAYSALLTGLHLRASQVARFNGLWAKQVVAAESLSEARTVVAAFRESGGRELPGTPA